TGLTFLTDAAFEEHVRGLERKLEPFGNPSQIIYRNKTLGNRVPVWRPGIPSVGVGETVENFITGLPEYVPTGVTTLQMMQFSPDYHRKMWTYEFDGSFLGP